MSLGNHYWMPHVYTMQEHLLPEEYVQTMRRTMLDQCPVSPYSEVSQMIAKELGSKPEALFASFEEMPIASASLAQVIHLSAESYHLRRLKQSLSLICPSVSSSTSSMCGDTVHL